MSVRFGYSDHVPTTEGRGARKSLTPLMDALRTDSEAVAGLYQRVAQAGTGMLASALVERGKRAEIEQEARP